MQAVIRLYREARRRKVFRTAALYIVGAWLSLQVADVLFPGFGIPNAAIQGLLWAAVAGLPVAVAFGWLFEVGPGGMRRTATAAAGEAALPQPLARRDFLILGAFATIAAVLIYRAAAEVRETPKEAALAEALTADPDAERLENSIAVLPFANISEDTANEYFCDGIAEEILTQLGAIRGLNVIGRTSSFAFKGSDYGIERISSLLGVRYVLQGSVRKAGDQLRVSAQLLDAEGVQVWGESFDRQLKNIFEIQSEVAAAVASQVASQVAPTPDSGHQPVLEAYDHFLRGRELLHQRNGLRAEKELRKAVEIDPLFAEAHAELALAILLSDENDAVNRARQALDRATELQPKLLRAQAIEGLWLMQDPPDAVAAERVLRGVLAQDPNMSDALNWLTSALSIQGRSDEARPVLERAARIDPLHAAVAANYAGLLVEDGRIEDAKRVFERVLAQPAPGPMVYYTAGEFYRSIGTLDRLNLLQREEALREATFSSIFFLLQNVAALGDWELADRLNDRLMRVPPQGPGMVYRHTILPALKGEFDLALLRLREAYKKHGLSFADLEAFDRAIAGTHLARAREFDETIAVLEPIVNPDSPYEAPEGPPAYSPPAHYLAWSYLQTGDRPKAARVLAAASSQCSSEPGRRRDGLSLHRCAEVELLRGNAESALDGLERAIEAGWREYYVRERDPIWAPLANNSRHRALMARVKADVDRQRAEVRKASPAAPFLAELDEAIAANSTASASGG